MIHKGNSRFYYQYPYPDIKFKDKKSVLKGPFAWRMRTILRVLKIKSEDFKGKKVLDIGCGTGEKPIFYALYGAQVDAIDQSEESLKCARHKAKELGLKINFMCSDLFKFKYIMKYDYVFCLGVLHHTSNPYLGFEKIVSAVKPNCKICIGLYHRYGRLPTTLSRFVLSLLPVSIDTKLRLIKRLFQNRWLNDRVIYDRFLVPYESTHTLKEVEKWFRNNKISLLSCHPEPKGLFGELGWLNRKGFFIVSGVLSGKSSGKN